MTDDEYWRAAVSRQWAEAWDSPEDAVYDTAAEDAAGECHHGCNGSPCGSERCTFLCHQSLNTGDITGDTLGNPRQSPTPPQPQQNG